MYTINNSNDKIWTQNYVFLFVDTYLMDNNINIKQLFNMNQESHLKLVKSIKKTSGFIKWTNFMWTHQRITTRFNIDIWKRYIHELKLLQQEKQKTIRNEEYLICGYNNNINYPSYINGLILLFYADKYKLITTNYGDVKECSINQQNPRIATLLMDNTKQYRKHEELLYNIYCENKSYVTLDEALNISTCTEFIIKFRWYNETNQNWMCGEGIYFGYFWGDTHSQIEKNRMECHSSCDLLLNGFEPLFYKSFRNDRAIKWNETTGRDVFFNCNSVTPFTLTDSIWKLKINSIKKIISIFYKGICIHTFKLKYTKYILPIFGLIGEKGDSIEVMETYLH